jgi:hypothetical protein
LDTFSEQAGFALKKKEGWLRNQSPSFLGKQKKGVPFLSTAVALMT